MQTNDILCFEYKQGVASVKKIKSIVSDGKQKVTCHAFVNVE